MLFISNQENEVKSTTRFTTRMTVMKMMKNTVFSKNTDN